MSILDSSFAAYTETEPATKITNKVNNTLVGLYYQISEKLLCKCYN